MDRALWQRYLKSPPGKVKQLLLGKLLAAEESLVQTFVAKFIAGTQTYVKDYREDLAQAARIGIIRAIDKWDPDKGAFSTIAGFECRHEMQQVIRHVCPITHPKSAYLPRKMQDRIASFYAEFGRMPCPEEVGTTDIAVARMQKATAEFVPVDEDQLSNREGERTPEEMIDAKRDVKALNAFIKRLSPVERREFWSGKRPDLTAAAKEYIAKRRDIR